ncbi:TPA: hypothetical protein SB194_001734 [Campylobacter coli]|nr:hypothetical protein [Campylobacter coli]
MKTNYTELERKEGQINGIPYTVLKVEYPNLKELKDNDLLMKNDKGQWLCGYVGLEHEQKLDFDKIGNEVCIAPVYLPKFDTDLFKNNPKVTKIVYFDQNHSWNRSRINTQLDEDLCLKDIEKIINHIIEHNKIKNKNFTLNDELEKQINDNVSLLQKKEAIYTQTALKKLINTTKDKIKTAKENNIKINDKTLNNFNQIVKKHNFQIEL